MSFHDVISGALATVRTVAGVSITYRRGAYSVDLTATTGRSRIELALGDGSSSVIDARDFLIATEDLILNSVQVLPSPGDTITEESGGTTYTYRVLDLFSEQCYQFSDFARTQLRIHTKLIGKE